MNKERLKRLILRPYLPFLLFFLTLLFILWHIRLIGGDDFCFFRETQKSGFDLFNFLIMRYHTWTGRVLLEFFLMILVQLPLKVWKIINSLWAVLFVISISRIVTSHSDNQKTRMYLNIVLCLSFFWIYFGVLKESVFWFTGSFIYLWPTSAALYSAISFKKILNGEKLNIFEYLPIIICTVIASNQEQVAAISLCLALIINGYLFFAKKKVHPLLIIQNFITLFGTVFLSSAPGNYIRYGKEIGNWYPNFNTLTVFEKFFKGMEYLLNHLFSNEYVLMITIVIISAILVIKKYQEKAVRLFSLLLVGIVLSSVAVNNLARNTTASIILFGYGNIYHYLPQMLFLYTVIYLPVQFFLIWRKHQKTALVTLCYLGGLCSALILSFSPTIYASSFRIFFTLDTCLLVILTFLIKNSFQTFNIDKLL